MKKLQEIWNKTGHTITAFSPYYQEKMIRLMQEYDAPNFWFILNWVRASEPEPFNPEEMVDIIGPYSTGESTLDRFNQFTERGFLQIDADGSLTLSDTGRGLIEGFFDSAHEALAEVDPLPSGELVQLQELLSRLVDAAAKASDPAEKYRLDNSRWTDPGDDAPASVRIDQYVTDLYRFRDDAHIAAWSSNGINGKVWETLTFVWQDDANTAAELAERLSFRGYSEADYGAALEKLVIKGWVEEIEGRYQVTPHGKRIREEAEEKTNQLFFGPWSVLSDKEIEQLDDLVTRLNANLDKAGLEITWDHLSSVSRGFIPVTRTAVDSLFEEYFKEPRFFYPTHLATGAEPEAYTIETYMKINPYGNPDRLSLILNDASDAGLLDNGSGAYRVSKKGRKALDTVNDSFYKRLGELDILPDEDLSQVSDLLERLIKASLDATEPSQKPATDIVHNTHPKTEYPTLAKIDMQMDDLRAFRDDAHIAAWRPYGVDGRTWETLSFVWQGEARSASKLVETLPFRGYEEVDYANSLNQLADRGLIQKDAGEFKPTEDGKTLRLEAEETTNRIFFEPWQVLEENEQAQLRNLLIRMKINLENLAERDTETAGS